MNWMGGSLLKSRHARGSVIARQKQHFARIRNSAPRKRKGPYGSPGDFDYGEQNYSRHLSDGCGLGKTNSRLPKSVDLAPHVDTRSRDAQSADPSMSSLYTITTQDDQRQSVTIADQIDPMFKDGPTNDIFDATSIRNTAKPIASLNTSTFDCENTQNTQETLEVRKTRLLRQHEWVGASILRPIKLRHRQTPHDPDRFAKRRKVSEHHKAKYGAKLQSRVVSPFSKPRTDLRYSPQPGYPYVQHLNGSAERRKGVRICIGERQVTVGRSSSGTNVRNMHENALLSQNSSSEVMLLDCDDMNVARYTTRGTYHPMDTECRPSQDLLDGSDTSKFTKVRFDHDDNDIPDYPRYKPYYTTHKNPSGGIYEAQIINNDVSEFGLHERNGSPYIYSDEPYQGIMTPEDPLRSLVSLQQEQQTPEALLLHPIPISSKTSKILRQDSNTSSSMVAQFGGVSPPVPKSQIDENETWKKWLSSSDDQERHAESESKIMSKDKCRQHWSTCSHILADDKSNAQGRCVDDQHTTYPKGQGRPILTQSPVRDTSSEILTTAETQIDYRNTFTARTWGNKARNVAKLRSSKSSAFHASKGLHVPGKMTAVHTRLHEIEVEKLNKLDPDKAWMKFVFPSDEEEAEELVDAHTDEATESFRPDVISSPRSSLCVEISMVGSLNATKEQAKANGPVEQVPPADYCSVQPGEDYSWHNIPSYDSEKSFSSSPDPLSVMAQLSQSDLTQDRSERA